jgi:hypothetical protein
MTNYKADVLTTFSSYFFHRICPVESGGRGFETDSRPCCLYVRSCCVSLRSEMGTKAQQGAADLLVQRILG